MPFNKETKPNEYIWLCKKLLNSVGIPLKGGRVLGAGESIISFLFLVVKRGAVCGRREGP